MIKTRTERSARTRRDPLLAVVQVHKTAGTTLAGMLKRAHGNRHCTVYAEDRDAPFYPAADLERVERLYPRLRSISGHDIRVYGDLEATGRDLRYLTFLRDPVVRCASHYQYDRQVGNVDMPLEQWLDDSTSNRMVQQIAGPGATAADAINLLDRFELIGLVERFDESLVMLQRRVGLPSITYARKWVAPADRIKLSVLGDAESRTLIAAHNEEDRILYRHVLEEIYPRQVAEYGPTLAADTEQFRSGLADTSLGRLYSSPRYLAYVAKWRLIYLPWINRRRR